MADLFEILQVRCRDELDFAGDGSGEVFKSHFELSLKIKIKNDTIINAAEGCGPVEALDKVLRKILKPYYARISEIELRKFEPEIVQISEDGASSMVRTVVTMGFNGTEVEFEAKDRNISNSGMLAYIKAMKACLLELYPPD